MLVDVFGWFGRAVVYRIFIAVYDIESFRWCFKVADSTIDDIPKIYIWDQSYLFLFANPVVIRIIVVLAIPFRGLIKLCGTRHQIYADRIFDLVLHGVNDLGFATYN